MSERQFSKQAELDFMHNFRHDTEGDRWAKHEIETLRQQLAGWLKANSPGGWIDDLRQQVTLLRDGQYDIARSSAAIGIERCKNATGMRRKIDMYVSANQCAEDVTEALAETEPKP